VTAGAVNRAFDRFPHPELRFGRRSTPAFRVFLDCGIAAGIALAIVLAVAHGRSVPLVLAIAAAAVASFHALALLRKHVSGAEVLVFYHHAAAAGVAAVAVIVAAGEPLLPYLDLVAVAIIAVLSSVRIGCFSAGCCHGRPARLGVSYGPDHAAAGFPPWYVGVRLLPVQLVESAWTLTVVALSALVILPGAAPGATLAFAVAAYAVGRFLFEFVRGDADRAYLLGFSEAQWTSAALVCLVAVLGQAGVLPSAWWQWGAAAVVATASALALVGRLHRGLASRFGTPSHVEELASILATPSFGTPGAPDPGGQPQWIDLHRTSLGVLLSASRIQDGPSDLTHYALSLESGKLSAPAAQMLGRLIVRIAHGTEPSSGTLVPGGGGCFHLVVRDSDAAGRG
jgi:Prolipoprotein diacylglyceryl transferase